MIQYMESRRFFDVILKLIQKIRIERDHFAAFPAYEMVMIVFCLIQQQMTDLIAHTPVIKVDPVYELHIPEKLESPVHCRQPDLGMFFRHKLIDILPPPYDCRCSVPAQKG